jgi:hypothetical protein
MLTPYVRGMLLCFNFNHVTVEYFYCV